MRKSNFITPLTTALLAGVSVVVGGPAAAQVAGEGTVTVRDVVIRPSTPTRIIVNGQPVASDQSPLLLRSPGDLSTQILVPIRFVVESLGATVYWDPEAQTAVVIRGRNNIALKVGSDAHAVNGLVVKTPAPVRIIGGRTMVPIRFVSNALGATVVWDAPTHTVSIDLPTVAGDPTPITGGAPGPRPGDSTGGGNTP